MAACKPGRKRLPQIDPQIWPQTYLKLDLKLALVWNTWISKHQENKYEILMSQFVVFCYNGSIILIHPQSWEYLLSDTLQNEFGTTTP